MKELNAEAYVSCLTLISASGSSFIAINLGQDLMGGCSLSGRACSDWDCLLALKERWHGMSDIRTMLQVHNESSKMFSLHFWSDFITIPFHLFVFCFFLIKIALVMWGKNADGQGGREGVFLVRFKDDMSESPRLWCFLAGFRQRLTIWWSGSVGLLKSPAHPGPSRLALQWQTL